MSEAELLEYEPMNREELMKFLGYKTDIVEEQRSFRYFLRKKYQGIIEITNIKFMVNKTVLLKELASKKHGHTKVG
jgi:hypothetical protein